MGLPSTNTAMRPSSNLAATTSGRSLEPVVRKGEYRRSRTSSDR